MTRDLTHMPDAGDGGFPKGNSRPELEALRWVVRMNSGEASLAEQAKFAEWCARAPENRPALTSAYRLWLATGPALRAVGRAPARSHWPMLALAASLLLLVSFGTRLVLDRGPAAPAGAVAQLADAGGYCRLLLGDGAASFDVTPDPTRGAAGGIGETRVRVPGSAFSLRPYAAGVLVTVTDGRVQYKDGQGVHIVPAGQQMRCNAARARIADTAAAGRAHEVAGRSIRSLLAALANAYSEGRVRQLLRHPAALN